MYQKVLLGYKGDVPSSSGNLSHNLCVKRLHIVNIHSKSSVELLDCPRGFFSWRGDDVFHLLLISCIAPSPKTQGLVVVSGALRCARSLGLSGGEFPLWEFLPELQLQRVFRESFREVCANFIQELVTRSNSCAGFSNGSFWPLGRKKSQPGHVGLWQFPDHPEAF